MDSVATWSSDALLAPGALGPTLKMFLLFSVLSLVPSLLIMTTCYVRIAVVLGILRQAWGIQQFPPQNVIAGLSLMLSATVMWPVWSTAYEQGIRPYTEGTYSTDDERRAAFSTAVTDTLTPIRDFMSRQIEATGNEAAIDLLMQYHAQASGKPADAPAYYEDVPLSVLLPAYMLSELKTAFVIGIQLFLPFVIIDLVVAAITAASGLAMLPPTLVSLPLKLLLFVLIDGWYLTVELLLNSIQPLG
ncbi:Flagellar biosynthetic protein FliP precursor [Maioricimonas rarisocia]|uniref:Flagellar biosynthetic protein FliP n=1 Tax=Maioricimonas rarisocia TaxID=2528026 RepID=A0A517ZDX9_9PLAN|nr:EscR/YscR/HrcR family type III secretion system export apparatus protein [Maioricimonas rarisocia]QDU40691.1 Flagellar biosynthetic protein FliP precursor [Maioricimonas rarisocia]